MDIIIYLKTYVHHIYWGEAIEWKRATDYMDGKPTYDFSGFNNTYWEITDKEVVSYFATYLMEIENVSDINEMKFYLSFKDFKDVFYEGRNTLDSNSRRGIWKFRYIQSIVEAVLVIDGEICRKDIYLTYRGGWVGMEVNASTGIISFSFTDDIYDEYDTPTSIGHISKTHDGYIPCFEPITKEEFDNKLENK